jgi:hypothetical protein
VPPVEEGEGVGDRERIGFDLANFIEQAVEGEVFPEHFAVRCELHPMRTMAKGISG